MHELLSLAFEILHFESYLTTRNWEEVMGTILQEKKIGMCQIRILAYQPQRI